MRIAVVDDSPGIGLVLTRYFARLGHRCEHVPDAATALEMLSTPPLPDVMLIDLMMPGMSGADLVREMRRRPDLAKVPVVLLSGYAPTAEELPPQGTFSAVLAKPFELEELRGVVEGAAAGRSALRG